MQNHIVCTQHVPNESLLVMFTLPIVYLRWRSTLHHGLCSLSESVQDSPLCKSGFLSPSTARGLVSDPLDRRVGLRRARFTRKNEMIVVYTTILHCNAILGRRQPGLMRRILLRITPLVQDRSLDLLTRVQRATTNYATDALVY